MLCLLVSLVFKTRKCAHLFTCFVFIYLLSLPVFAGGDDEGDSTTSSSSRSRSPSFALDPRNSIDSPRDHNQIFSSASELEASNAVEKTLSSLNLLDKDVALKIEEQLRKSFSKALDRVFKEEELSESQAASIKIALAKLPFPRIFLSAEVDKAQSLSEDITEYLHRRFVIRASPSCCDDQNLELFVREIFKWPPVFFSENIILGHILDQADQTIPKKNDRFFSIYPRIAVEQHEALMDALKAIHTRLEDQKEQTSFYEETMGEFLLLLKSAAFLLASEWEEPDLEKILKSLSKIKTDSHDNSASLKLQAPGRSKGTYSKLLEEDHSAFFHNLALTIIRERPHQGKSIREVFHDRILSSKEQLKPKKSSFLQVLG
jgi:hypothetical protein